MAYNESELQQQMATLAVYVKSLVRTPVLLVVEDNEDDLLFFNRQLNELDQKFQVVSTLSGERALDNLKATKFDLIFLDLRLGEGMDGVEVIRRMNELGIKTPVVAVSGTANGPIVAMALGLGAVLHLQKPVTVSHLRKIFTVTKT